MAQKSAKTKSVKKNAIDKKLAGELVVANRILFNQGVVDGFGHVSIRDPENPDRFLLARSMAPVLVTPKDILLHDLDGATVSNDKRTPYLERFIHGSIYKARPDVMAVVHSHSPSIIPFGITEQKLRPVYHMSSFLGTDVPVFEIQDFAGDTDMLVTSVKLGDDLARCLGRNTVSLMRGHGSVAVGESLTRAVYRAVYAELNAKLQSEALRLGDGVKYLTAGEAGLSRATQDKTHTRAYEMWARDAMAKR